VSDRGVERETDHDSEAMIAEILRLLARASEHLEPENSDMKQWIGERFPDPDILDLLQNTTFTTLRVIDAIGRLEPVNGITIAKQYQIPKGTVSKVTRRLIAQKLIVKEALPNNKKESIFQLTPLGKELFQAHQAFDQAMEKGFIRFLRRYDPAELRFLIRVLQDVSEASFLYMAES
jgi:DNA-binding MarR family transcriptional regulator